MDTVDQERRKLERLETRFDKLAGEAVKYRREVVADETRLWPYTRHLLYKRLEYHGAPPCFRSDW